MDDDDTPRTDAERAYADRLVNDLKARWRRAEFVRAVDPEEVDLMAAIDEHLRRRDCIAAGVDPELGITAQLARLIDRERQAQEGEPR